MNRHYKTLELDKILEKLAAQTSLDDARNAALELEPSYDLKKAQLLLNQTDDALSARLPLAVRSTAPQALEERRQAAVFRRRSF